MAGKADTTGEGGRALGYIEIGSSVGFDTGHAVVRVTLGGERTAMSPDDARLIGAQLIECAAVAETEGAVVRHLRAEGADDAVVAAFTALLDHAGNEDRAARGLLEPREDEDDAPVEVRA